LLAAISYAALWISGIAPNRIPDLVLNSTYLLFLTLGISTILSIGEIDLSVYGISALSAILSLWINSLISTSSSAFFLILTTILIATLLSFLNALLIVTMKRDSLLVTIASFSAFYGIAMIVYLNSTSKNKVLYTIPDSLVNLSDTSLLGMRFEIPIITATMLLLWFIMHRTKLGLAMKAVGQSSQSARYSGININTVKTISFLVAGALYGIGCVLSYSRFSSTRPSELVGDTVIPIMCAVLSGSEIKGGRFPLLFTLAGVSTFICLQQTVMSLKLFPAESYHAIFGTVLLIYILIRYKSQYT